MAGRRTIGKRSMRREWNSGRAHLICGLDFGTTTKTVRWRESYVSGARVIGDELPAGIVSACFVGTRCLEGPGWADRQNGSTFQSCPAEPEGTEGHLGDLGC